MSEPLQDDSRIADGIPARVRQILATTQNVPARSIGPDTRLEADLGVDSLASIQIFVALEEEFGFAVRDEDRLRALSISSVAELVEFVCGECARQPEPLQ